MCKFLLLTAFFISTTAFPYTPLHYGEFCDWRSPPDPCDAARGLACTYGTNTCACWDQRKIYSTNTHRCVGKAGEECSYYESERLCTENAYCLEDRTLSPIPLCMCLKGYFRSDNGSCVKYSMHGESCEPFPTRQACETESGLKCIHFKCQCEPGQIYDPELKLCLAKAGQKCSKSLNNCVKNAECNEKLWTFDHDAGETKLSGYRCGCKPGLKITEGGLCTADYGGPCEKSADCFGGESLTCLNSVCQCHPISQVYDKGSKRCLNLVGTKCHADQDTNNSTGGKTRTNSKRSSISNTTSTTTTTSTEMPPSLRTFEDDGIIGTEGADCIPNAECSRGICRCVNGSTETLMKTCLLDYGEDCHNLKKSREKNPEIDNSLMNMAMAPTVKNPEMKCNVFEGLICNSDLGKCLCADPSLVYDFEMKSCVAILGGDCGRIKFDMLDLKDEFKEMIFINCESNSTCQEKTEGGKTKRVCVKGGRNSLSKIMFNNANVISDSE